MKEPIPDLKSPANDAALMEAMLTRHFNYSKENIVSLHDKEATRTKICDALIQMLETCKAGDHFTFYYSGHGSQLRNTLSPEPDKLDEAIVPADGIYYNAFLRDKELAVIFQQFIDRGVVLTVIIDSCHSGSMARGSDLEIKAVGSPETDLNDPLVYPQPETQGAVVLSAAQDYQQAAGSKDINGLWTSYFTRVLTRTINQETQNLSAEQIFDAVMATMRYRSYKQIPVMAANDIRRKSTLFGEKILNPQNAYPVLRTLDNKKVHLAGGPATGVDEGAVLINRNSGIELTVETINGINSCTCIISKGDLKTIAPGTSFELIRRGGSGSKNALRISIPKPSESIKNASSTDAAIHQVIDSLLYLLEHEYHCAEITSEEIADYVVNTTGKENNKAFYLSRNPLFNDLNDPYPARSDQYVIEQDPMQTATEIAKDICKLSRMKGWLSIESSMDFPYQLQIRRNNEKLYLRGGECKEGDLVEVVLQQLPQPDTAAKAFIYVFGIDSNGKTVLLYPLSGSNVENYLPLQWTDKTIPISAFRIGPPLGTDHLIFLASSTPLMNPSLIQQESIRTRSGSDDYIENMIYNMGLVTRGASLTHDTGYFVDRITIISSK